MDRLQIMNQRQQEGIEAWAAAGFVGTLNMAVGTGKTITALKGAMKAYEKGILAKGDKIRFMAETNARWLTIEEEMDQFEQITGIDVRELFEFEYQCYQAVPKWEGSAMDIYDEIHMALTAKYHTSLLESHAVCKLGLSATIPRNKSVFREDLSPDMLDKIRQSDYDTATKKITEWINKGQLLQVLCPIVYEYDMEEAVKDGVLSQFETYVIYHELDDVLRPYKQKYGWVSEKKMYEIYMKAMKKNYSYDDDDEEKSTKAIKNKQSASAFLGRKMAQMLTELPSKRKLLKAILEIYRRPTIVFSKYKDPMRGIVEKVAEGDVTAIVEDFNNGRIRTIGTARKLQQGITLKGIENAVMMSYTSQSWQLIQQLGRVIRWAPNKRAILFIIVTKGTLEEKWFEKMTHLYGENLNLLGHVSLNIKGHIDGVSILQKYHAHE